MKKILKDCDDILFSKKKYKKKIRKVKHIIYGRINKMNICAKKINRGKNMYDLKNLNDYEFEMLCNDIVEKKLKKKFYRFPKGKDKGIDVCDNIDNPKLIVQVKHYIKSKYSNLKSVMKNEEIDKIKKINLEDYFLYTSLELNKANKNELFEIMKEYMKKSDNILDGIEINDFLEKEENIDIVKKNYKLWLSASNVLELVNNKNIFIDCDELIYDIENNIKRFVETKFYREAKNELDKDNIIIIVGSPGVGKSTMSKMLLLEYANENYVVRYSSENNLSDLKKVLSLDKEKKEIILLDDFLGQHYLDLKSTKSTELKSLISFVIRNKNKKIILNSRITILNEAKKCFQSFDDLMQNYDKSIYLINLDNMKKMEKAKILYNHMFFNNLPIEYFREIQRDNNYFKIINHKNYNPRIIEYVTKKNNYELINSNEYFSYIEKKLDNPEDVWRDEFENRLKVEDRIFMHVLYSLTNNYINISYLEESFNNNIKKNIEIDNSINVFNRVISRLSNSLIIKLEEKNEIKVGVLNPSINDYIKNEISKNLNEQIKIVENAIYIEQIYKIDNSNEQIIQIIKNKTINLDLIKMKSLNKSIYFYFIKNVAIYDIFERNIIKSFQEAFERSYQNIKTEEEIYEYSNVISKIINNKYVDFYELKSILLDSSKMKFLIEKMNIDALDSVLEFIFYEHMGDNIEYEENYNKILNCFKYYIIDNIENEVKKEIEEYEMEDLVSSVIDRSEEYEIEEYKDEKNDIIFKRVCDEVDDNINEKCQYMIKRFSYFIDIEICEIDTNFIRERIEIKDFIYNNIESRNDDYNEDVLEDYKYNEFEEIRSMFDR